MNDTRIPVYLMQEPFVTIPFKLITDKSASSTDIIVFLALASYGNWRSGITWVGARELTKRARKKERTIRETITHLEKIGWATKIRRGCNKTNIIVLHGYKNQNISDEKQVKIVELAEKEIRDWNK